jgi:hypothetical protein
LKPIKQPWMKFYPADWRSEPTLRLCCIAARGLWAEMMCIMHDAEPYGSLLVNGKRIDKKQLAGLSGITEKDCTALLMELEGNGVFSRDADGTIYSRRMRRDHAKAIKDKENGKGGGNPKLKGGVNPQDKGEDKAQKLDARTSEARASDAGASDPRTRLFRDGLATLAKLTGKGPDACRSFVGKCLKAASDDAVTVLGLIEDAERNQVADPSAWIAARLKGPDHAKPKSAVIQAADDLIAKLASFDGPSRGADELRSGAGEAAPRLLSHG